MPDVTKVQFQSVKRVIGLDPGDLHCGVVSIDAHTGHLFGHLTCHPYELTDVWLPTNLTDSLIVIEEFRLYPGKVIHKSHDQLRVVETIGVIKYLCRQARTPWTTISPSQSVPFFKNRSHPSGLKPHEVSAWKVAEYWRLFRAPGLT